MAKKKKQEEIVHFWESATESDEAPCGDNDDQSLITNDMSEVTCQFCLHAMKQNGTKDTRVLH